MRYPDYSSCNNWLIYIFSCSYCLVPYNVCVYSILFNYLIYLKLFTKYNLFQVINAYKICSYPVYSMCSLAVSTQDSPAVEPRSNPGSGKILMSENLRLYTTSPVVMC